MAAGDIWIVDCGVHAHYGIEVWSKSGELRIVHFDGKNGANSSGTVVLTDEQGFHKGRPFTRLRPTVPVRERMAAAKRALAELGRTDYCLKSNNCEHLVNRAYGSNVSHQVDGAAMGATLGSVLGAAAAGTAFRTVIFGVLSLGAPVTLILGGALAAALLGGVLGTRIGIAAGTVMSSRPTK